MAFDQTPDVLVLGAGGILGEAWMSAVLAGLDDGDGFDSRECRGYVGTSAGSIVAASLAAGIEPGARLGRLPEQNPAEDDEPAGRARGLSLGLGAVAGAAAAPFAAFALSSTAFGGALVRRAAISRIPTGRRSLAGVGRWIDETGLDWDGRLRIATLEVETGRRVIFGTDGAPELSVGAAVQASCAIPGVFKPVRAGDRSYVDGGAWSLTNLDAADVERGDAVLCLNPTGAGALGPVSRGVAATEALVLRRRGAQVTAVNPDQASSAAMGNNLMDGRRRSAAIEAGLAQGRRLAAAARRRAA
jgi:NTE family protein